jgi:uncharacterized small protein (DUF1192 family)
MVTILQAEYQRNSAVCPESTFGIDTEKTASADYFKPVSQHASEVAALFYGPDSHAGKAAIVSKVYLDEATGYSGRDGLGSGLVNMPPPNPPRWPAKALAMVENHSYGWAHHSYSSGLARMDERIERDNVVAVVAAPNEGSQTNGSGGANGFYSQCKNVIVAGSTYGTHYDWPNRPCDVLVDQQWTSWCAPVLASAACLVVAEFIKANYPYRWNEVKDILIKTATNKVLNVDAAVAEAKKIAAPKQEEEDPIMIKELEEKLALKEREIDQLKAEIANCKNLSVAVPIEGNFYPFKNSTEIRAAMVGEKTRAPIAIAFPHAGQWIHGKGIYDKAGKIIYATLQ